MGKALDQKVRLHYLQAMGIDVWLPRKATENAGRALSSVEESAWPESKSETMALPAQGLFGWGDLEGEVHGCEKCGLCQTRTQTVFGTGNRLADWMVIGEAPGQHEDEQGKPFVGRAGQLLTEMLTAVGLPRDDVFITNILKCRPPGNRDPKPEEAESCAEYLNRQRELIQPKIILSVGRISAQTLLNTDTPIGKLRGRVHEWAGVPLIVVYHPSYLLRSPLEKRKVWQDLQLAMTTYNKIKDSDARLAG